MQWKRELFYAHNTLILNFEDLLDGRWGQPWDNSRLQHFKSDTENYVFSKSCSVGSTLSFYVRYSTNVMRSHTER